MPFAYEPNPRFCFPLACLWVYKILDTSTCANQGLDKRCDQAMLAIGAPLYEWTLFLLLCSIPTAAYSQSTSGLPVNESSVTATSSTTKQHASSAASPRSSSTSRTYTDIETACPYRTINYITHTLPQQCAKTSWSPPSEGAPTGEAATEVAATHSQQISIPWARDDHPGSAQEGTGGVTTGKREEVGRTAGTGSETGSLTTSSESEAELETDSPLDNANFLSFEEWKKRNLEQAGQSPENVGQGRAAPSDQPARRRPVNVNALDSLGDEAEIELDFSGFGNTGDGDKQGNNVLSATHQAGVTAGTEGEKKAAPSSWALSKDVGKTCKERFNYASFDCAATVLKTNKQAKSATSILVENKDSYMLNECSADNKFLIVELCDDILVDTLVLANYEFFSSMFRHFRVSVSDRYPVKMERWRTLATFEARNSRDIQPFLITEPQIWARYLRVEFLTQYGNEFYCPLSLLRVHGTTMMEQFRREEEETRGGDDDDLELEAQEVDIVKPAIDSGPLPSNQIPVQPVKGNNVIIETSSTVAPAPSNEPSSADVMATPHGANSVPPQASSTPGIVAISPRTPDEIHNNGTIVEDSSFVSPSPDTASLPHVKDNATIVDVDGPAEGSSSSGSSSTTTQTQDSPVGGIVKPSTAIATRNNSGTIPVAKDTASISSSGPAMKTSSDTTVVSHQPQSQQRPSTVQPSPAAPSTQESFFKSLHKRLQYLEANSTLSLQYIEEQSRILRDAFMKVEKRQLVKTEKFLDHLNSTVLSELKGFRTMYDQLWQSTVIELESMKERQKSEMGEIGTRLSLLADELVWQKRMAVVQSTLLLLCLGLVLFVRSGTLGSATDVPIVQQLGNKYTSFFEPSPPRSPPETDIARRRRTFRSMWRSDTSAGLSDHQSDGINLQSDPETDGTRSPVHIEHSPPTPDTPSALAESDLRSNPDLINGTSSTPLDENMDPLDDHAQRIQVLETQSGPATPNGTRDNRPSWEEVDRAIDQLKAEEKGKTSLQSSKTARDRKKRKSPLRRAHSSYDGAADDSPTQDSGDRLFLT